MVTASPSQLTAVQVICELRALQDCIGLESATLRLAADGETPLIHIPNVNNKDGSWRHTDGKDSIASAETVAQKIADAIRKYGSNPNPTVIYDATDKRVAHIEFPVSDIVGGPDAVGATGAISVILGEPGVLVRPGNESQPRKQFPQR